MDILYLLIPISLVLVAFAALGFWWALNRGQFDDLDVPAHAILLDDDRGAGADGDTAERRPPSIAR